MTTTEPTRVLSFIAAGRAMALPAARVAAVLARPAITRAPRSPAALAGIARLRGAPTPVISVAAALDGTAAGEGRVILLRGGDPVALAVDAVGDLRDGDIHDERVVAGDESFALADLDLMAAAAKVPVSARRADRTTPAWAKPAARLVQSYLGFRVGGERYGLPLQVVSAVTPAPPGVSGVVSSMSYRGGILPLIDLRSLLGQSATAEGGKVVIVRLDGEEVGLRVDRLETVLRASEERIGVAPSILNRDAAAARISTIVRTEDGLVAVLSPERLLDNATAAQAAAISRPAGEAATTIERVAEDLVFFSVAGRRLALPASAVPAVLRGLPPISIAPGARPDLLGLFNRGGRAVPLIDLRQRQGVTEGGRGMVLIVEHGDAAAGLLVDRVGQGAGEETVERLDPAGLLAELRARLGLRRTGAGVAA